MTLLLRFFLYAFLLSLYCYNPMAAAQSHTNHHDNHVNHDNHDNHDNHNSNNNPNAHSHGIAHMNVVFQQGQFFLALETPAANMLGFEHLPQNDEQWQRVSELKKTLNTADKIFALTPNCQIQNIETNVPFNKKNATKKNPSTLKVKTSKVKTPHDDHQQDKHDHHSDSGHNSGHNSDHNSHQDKETHTTKKNNHRDISLSYEWKCKSTTAPTVQLHLFNLYPSFDKIYVQWIANNKQGAATLNKHNAVLEIAK